MAAHLEVDYTYVMYSIVHKYPYDGLSAVYTSQLSGPNEIIDFHNHAYSFCGHSNSRQ